MCLQLKLNFVVDRCLDERSGINDGSRRALFEYKIYDEIENWSRQLNIRTIEFASIFLKIFPYIFIDISLTHR